MRKIYAEYGWPDLEKYRKEDCIQVLKLWYKDFDARQIEQMQMETRFHWGKQGIDFPESSETDDLRRSKVEDGTLDTGPEGEK